MWHYVTLCDTMWHYVTQCVTCPGGPCSCVGQNYGPQRNMKELWRFLNSDPLPCFDMFGPLVFTHLQVGCPWTGETSTAPACSTAHVKGSVDGGDTTSPGGHGCCLPIQLSTCHWSVGLDRSVTFSAASYSYQIRAISTIFWYDISILIYIYILILCSIEFVCT